MRGFIPTAMGCAMGQEPARVVGHEMAAPVDVALAAERAFPHLPQPAGPARRPVGFEKRRVAGIFCIFTPALVASRHASSTIEISSDFR